MRSVIFGEDSPVSKEELIGLLFEDETDPRSNRYRRTFVRPRFQWELPLYAAAMAILTVGVFCGLRCLELSKGWAAAGAAVFAAVLLLLFAKRIIICIVKTYQRYAPERLRNKCRFEPSCSEYMILSLQKYGLFKGVRKGVGRLMRCNIEGGGYDMP